MAATGVLLLSLAFAWLGRRSGGDRGVQAAGFAAGLGYAVPGTVLAVGAMWLLVAAERAAPWLAGLALSSSLAGLLLALCVRFFRVGHEATESAFQSLRPSLMESARIQGASEWRIFWHIVMPNVKPAWLTLGIFQFQQMWGNTGSLFLRNEELKPLQYSLQQITAGGVSRAGAAAVVTFIIAAVPITFFLISQSSILETMTTSGLKE